MKTKEQRLIDEKEFHNEIFENQIRKEKVGRFYSINESIKEKFKNRICNNVRNKTILSYGCGMGDSILTELANQGGICHGIDISDYAINQLSEISDKNGLGINYQVMDAEELSYDNNYFDTIYGTGILHHLNLDKAFETISAKLKDSGKAIFIEPLGHNPLINKFRNKTPEIRTEDEHPLLIQDFDSAKKYFGKVKIKYFYLSTLALPVLFGNNFPKKLISVFDKFDSMLFGIFPFLRKHSWQIIIELSEPKGETV